MKKIHSLLSLSALVAISLLASGCAKNEDVKQAGQEAKADATALATNIKNAVPDSWEAIKDYTHDKREDFAAALDRMAGREDAEIEAVNAKLTGLPESAARERDRAVKEFNKAMAGFKSELGDLRGATAETWAGAKEKADQSWQRVQAAYEKAKSIPAA